MRFADRFKASERSVPSPSGRLGQRALEFGSRPAYADHRPALRKYAVLDRELASGALKQGLGDEKSQSKAGTLARRLLSLRPVTFYVGLADAPDDLGRKTRAVVADRHRYAVGVPGCGHIDL